jgi:hypothetical protein
MSAGSETYALTVSVEGTFQSYPDSAEEMATYLAEALVSFGFNGFPVTKISRTFEPLADRQAREDKLRKEAEWRAYWDVLGSLKSAQYVSRHNIEKIRGGSEEYHCDGCDRTEGSIFAFLDTCCLGWSMELGELRIRHEDGEHRFVSRSITGSFAPGRCRGCAAELEPGETEVCAGTGSMGIDGHRNVTEIQPYERVCPLCIEERQVAAWRANHKESLT